MISTQQKMHETRLFVSQLGYLSLVIRNETKRKTEHFNCHIELVAWTLKETCDKLYVNKYCTLIL